jgi:citronellol/citronellal dehydrogenase
MVQASRTPEIMGDAAHMIFCKAAREFSGNFLIDDTFMASEGVTDFTPYRIDDSVPLMPDFFVPADVPPPKGVTGGV